MSNPFPLSYPDLLVEDSTLKGSLDAAVAEALSQFRTLLPDNLVISIVAISNTKPFEFKHAGIQFLDNDYTASLVKVGVMYAAYELQKSVNKIVEKATGGVSSPSVLFQNIHAEYDSWITERFREILNKLEIKITAKIDTLITPPKYEEIFDVVTISSGALTAMFKSEFDKNLHKMIIDGDNNAAAKCIEALGYSWINGALNAGGFFLPEIKKGIWVGGTFTGSLEPIRIPSKNDGPAAQVAQTYMMANLYAHMFQETLVDDGSSTEMLKKLNTSATIGKFPSLLDDKRRGLPPRNYKVTHSKIGLGALKTGAMVGSDGAIVEYKLSDGTTRKFIVVFQNYLYEKDTLVPIGYILDRTIQLYLNGRFQPMIYRNMWTSGNFIQPYPFQMTTDLYRATPIDIKYAQMGGSSSLLGHPIGPEDAGPDKKGRIRRYQHGIITWSKETGAHAIWGPISNKWWELGGRLFLGYALTDVINDGVVGSYAVFQNGHIYYTLVTGANEVHGAILEKYRQLGLQKGMLGYPVSDETRTADGKGRYNRFTFGSIYWSPETGAHEVHGLIDFEYERLGATTSKVGFPITDELDLTGVPGGKFNAFEGGVIRYEPSKGVSVAYR
jgi:hypothetical protein